MRALIFVLIKTTVYKNSIYRRADHASTVRHRRGFPRVHFAQFQGVPVPSHQRLCYRTAPARPPLIRGGGELLDRAGTNVFRR